MNTSIPNACWCQTTEEHMAGWVLLHFTYSCVLHFTYASVLSNTQPYKLTHVHTHTHTHTHTNTHTHTQSAPIGNKTVLDCNLISTAVELLLPLIACLLEISFSRI